MNPQGAGEAAYYSVDDGILTMRTAEGSKTGRTYRLKPGDDERRVAGRLGRQAWEKALDGRIFTDRLAIQILELPDFVSATAAQRPTVAKSTRERSGLTMTPAGSQAG
jgi:hypothetical protein